MKFFKVKSTLATRVCFTTNEIANLVFSKDYEKIAEIVKENFGNEKEIVDKVKALSEINAKSKNYEYWTALFALYDIFSNVTHICFNLKNTFNSIKDSIDNIQDLEKYKDDPPDVIVQTDKGFIEFELKRFNKAINLTTLSTFLNTKIIKYYSNHDRNYFVLIQTIQSDEVNLEVFKEVYSWIRSNNINPGTIAFSLNNMNKEIYTIIVWPQFQIINRPFIRGSKQFSQIRSKDDNQLRLTGQQKGKS